MYIIKNTERNREKASDFETFSLLYLLGIHNDHNSIDLVLIDCFNDVTGTNETVTEFWDIQSKGHRKITPLQIGEFLVTLYENYISQFPFKHLILLLEDVQDIHIVDKTNYFYIGNYTAQSKLKIKEGLIREYCRRQQIDVTNFIDKRIDTFLNIVEFSVASKDKVEYVKQIVDFKNKNIKPGAFYIEIFNEIRSRQDSLKSINVESKVVEEPIDVLQFKKYISRDQIVALLINRFVGIDLFNNISIPIEFTEYTKDLNFEDTRDLVQDCNSDLCRTYFNKNNKINTWYLLEAVITEILAHKNMSVDDIAINIPVSILSNVPTLPPISLRFFIARVKDGLL